MINVLAGVAGQLIGLFGQRGQATKEALKARVAMMERSWTDEFLVLYWFGPAMFLALFWPDRYTAYVAALTAQPDFFLMQGLITAAVFGLGKMNGRKK